MMQASSSNSTLQRGCSADDEQDSGKESDVSLNKGNKGLKQFGQRINLSEYQKSIGLGSGLFGDVALYRH